MYGFLAALQILTRLPAPLGDNNRLANVQGALGWFPAVGALLGLALVGFDALARLIFDQVVVDAFLVALLVVVTGAFHLDGLVDSVDGLAAGPGAKERLAAMRQAVAGTGGALAACIILLADFVALSALPPATRPAALFLAPVCGRTAIVLAYWLHPYGRTEATLSAQLKAGASTRTSIVAFALAGGTAFAVGGPGGLALLTLSLAIMHGIALLGRRRLPGLTGDLYGAICEVSQLAVLLAAPFALRR